MTLFGFAKTTKAIAKKYPYAKIFDDNIHKPHINKEGFNLYPSNNFDPINSVVEIPSPGIPPHHLLIQRARNLISDYDYFFKQMPYNVWISGTNGKTTTTEMMTFLLEDKGAVCGGNIGIPIASLDIKSSLWLLETSSFTLYYTNRASPGIYILLPISPHHISWHGSIEAYEKTKLKPLLTMKEGEIAIIPKIYENYPTNASVFAYENANDIATYFGIKSSLINFKGIFLLDALLAMSVDKILYNRVNYQKINNFKLQSHRQEKIIDIFGRTWINDSKATNMQATIELLKNYSIDDDIHIILGGKDEGINFKSFYIYLKEYNRLNLYLIGENAVQFAQYAKRYSINFLECQTLDNAIKQINKIHNKQSTAILSPASPSLDQFNSYISRGKQFKEKVLKLS